MSVHQWARQEIDKCVSSIDAQGFDQVMVLRALLSAVIERSSGVRPAADLAAELQFLAENLDDERDYSFMRP